MKLSIIVAAAENNVIGRENKMPWKLSGDMKFFKATTMGHPVVMGRKTFQSLGKPLPGRRNVMITRDAGFAAEGIETVQSPQEAVALLGSEDEVFVIGGGEIYRQFWDMADTIYLTRVHAWLEGDATIPDVAPEKWCETSRTVNSKDDKNDFDYTFITYAKK